MKITFEHAGGDETEFVKELVMAAFARQGNAEMPLNDPVEILAVALFWAVGIKQPSKTRPWIFENSLEHTYKSKDDETNLVYLAAQELTPRLSKVILNFARELEKLNEHEPPEEK